jgi:LCP family protein required for cell wall assembly
MMVASIDPINHTSTLLSLPRDLWVTVPNAGVMKINAAWETGEFKYLGKTAPGSTDPKAITAGFNLVDQTVSDVLGIDIDYNVLVDFQAFQQAVDTVGGVSVNVPTPLVDPTMAWQNGGNPTLAQAGVQQFSGAQALLSVRSRETSSDFARAARQRAVLVALKAKVVSLGTLSNPLKISSLLTTFGNNVQTDLSLSNASRLYSIVKGVGDAQTKSISLDGPNDAGDASDSASADDATGATSTSAAASNTSANSASLAAATSYVTTGNINGQSIVLPTAGLFNYQAIQQYVRLELPDPYVTQEHAKVLVLNGTTTPGLATTEANQLKTYGYNVVGAGNTPSSDWTQTTLVDLSHGKDKYTAHYLEERLGVTAATSLSDKTIQTNGADFVIILGSDDETTLTTPATAAEPPGN